MAIVVGIPGVTATSARKIIQSCLQQARVYAAGVSLNSVDANDGLFEMQLMIDEWSNETLICYANKEQSFVLQPNVNQYTIGKGAMINSTRPITINTGPGAAYLMDDNNIRMPLDVVEQDQWNQISLLTEQSDLPTTLFYDPQMPWGIINVWQMPAKAYTVYFDARLQLAEVDDLDQEFVLPPGYLSAIRNNLTIRLWPFFKTGTSVPELIIGLANRSLASIKRSNIRQSPSLYDTAIVSKAKSQWNIYTDEYSRRG